MTYKKTWFGYVLWVAFALSALVLFGVQTFRFLPAYFHIQNQYAIAGIIVLMVLAAAFFFFTARHLLPGGIARADGKNHYGATTIWTIGIVTLLLIGGAFLKVYLFREAADPDDFYSRAMVNGSAPDLSGVPMVNLYILLLRGLFLVFGNRMSVAYICQIVLFIGAVLFLALATERISGKLAAILMTSMVICGPVWWHRGLWLTEATLYFLLMSIGAYLCAGILCAKSQSRKTGAGAWILAVFAGLFSGILVYLDIRSALLLVLYGSVLFVWEENKKYPIGFWIGNVAVYLLFAAVGFGLSLMYFPGNWEMNILLVLKEWTDASLNGLAFRIPDLAYSEDFTEILTGLILSFLGLTGIFGFFGKKKTEKIIVPALLGLGLVLTEMWGLGADSFDGKYVIWLGLGLVAAASVQSLFMQASVTVGVPENTGKENESTVEKTDELEILEEGAAPESVTVPEPVMPAESAATPVSEPVAESKEIPVSEPAVEDIEAIISKPAAESIVAPVAMEAAESIAIPVPAATDGSETAPETVPEPMAVPVPATVSENDAAVVPAPKRRFIENPLPGPKKHIRKAMDFALQVTDEQLRFDVDVADNDDFDLPE